MTTINTIVVQYAGWLRLDSTDASFVSTIDGKEITGEAWLCLPPHERESYEPHNCMESESLDGEMTSLEAWPDDRH